MKHFNAKALHSILKTTSMVYELSRRELVDVRSKAMAVLSLRLVATPEKIKRHKALRALVSQINYILDPQRRAVAIASARRPLEPSHSPYCPDSIVEDWREQ